MWPRIFLTIFLLFSKELDVFAQRVEFISPPATLSTTSYIQPAGQFVIPAVIKPLITPVESVPEPVAPTVPSFPNFNDFSGFNGFNGFNDYNGLSGPFIPHPVPIYCNDDDDNWHHLLYFLIFAMRNRWGGNYGYSPYGYGGYGGGYGGGCGGGCGRGCGGGCGCGCGCDGGCGGYQDDCSCGYNDGCGNKVTYVPYPIPVPSNYPNSGLTCGCADGNAFTIPDDGCSCEIPTLQACGSNGNANEINLVIRADTCK